jgi:uncharacterized protein (TIGR03437 family)
VSKTLLFTIFAACLAAAALTAQTTPTVTASPTSVSFTYQIGSAKLPAAQKLSVKISSGTPAYTAANGDSTSLWLTVSPDSGTLPANLSLQVNPTGLGIGTYTTSGLTVLVSGVDSPVIVPVTLTITAAPATLTVNPTTLAFTAPPSPVTSQTVLLSTDGAPISFTVTSGATWLSVTPNVGVVLPGEQEILTITPDPTSLTPQASPYVGKISIAVSGTTTAAKAQSITVNFTVNSSTPYIQNIWPPTLPLNGAATTITILGGNFYKATVASISGVATPLVTTILSDSALLAVVPASELTTATSLGFVVTNPAPGGSSNPQQVAVANVPTITAVTNVASYGAIAISPGELVTIFGTNIGPSTPASMTITASGYVATTLSGVTLTIDSQPAPLLYVSQTQVTAQVPYEVTIGTGKQVSLTSGTNSPATSTVTTAAQAPGLFTSDGSGAGQAAALNYGATTLAYTLNTAANPAHLGDTILLYLTGEGDYYTPAPVTPVTGLIIPASLNPLPQLNPLPTVTIGGASATVAYAGPIVGSILGLLQINCVVPAGATTGKAVPVVVSINGVSTQDNVTLSIAQ